MGNYSTIEGFPIQFKKPEDTTFEEIANTFFNPNLEELKNFSFEVQINGNKGLEYVKDFLNDEFTIEYNETEEIITIELSYDDPCAKWRYDKELVYQLSLICPKDDEFVIKFYGEDGNWGYLITHKSVKSLHQLWFCEDLCVELITDFKCNICGSKNNLITVGKFGNVCTKCVVNGLLKVCQEKGNIDYQQKIFEKVAGRY